MNAMRAKFAKYRARLPRGRDSPDLLYLGSAQLEREREFVIYLSLGLHIVYPFWIFLQSEFSHV